MNLLSKIEITNFRCFRKQVSFSLDQGTYLIGINNAGKTAILDAIKFFFDENLFADEHFLNKTEFIGKSAGHNKSTIAITFNINALTTTRYKTNCIKGYGTELRIEKIVSFAEKTEKISSYYIIGSKEYEWSELPKEIKKLIQSVKISYIHPQEGAELLKKAQEKLRKRLLANWGRNKHVGVTQSLKKLQTDWDALRKKAIKYLSASLTGHLQEVWKGSETTIELPRSVEELIAISDILFQGDKKDPQIKLTSQGTGAQSTILYLTHFLLDSDRSLHTGEYHPIWLLEEPESFLHADLMSKLARQLNSELWLSSIQMIISTHSPILLASSRLGGENITWNLIENHKLKGAQKVEDWSEDNIKEIGSLMGDSNFYAYFVASQNKKLIYIEDSHSLTKEKYREAGVEITDGLNGISEVARNIEVLKNIIGLISQGAYFIVDSDKGKKEKAISKWFSYPHEEKSGFKRYKIGDNLFLILLPEGSAIEDFFDEYDSHLSECVSSLFDKKTWKPSTKPLGKLSRTHGEIRGKKSPNNIQEAKILIKNSQDVKNTFWEKVKKKNFNFALDKIEILNDLLK